MGEGYASDWGEAGDKLAHAALRHTCAARYLDTEVGKFRKTLNAAILLFGTGVVAAFGFFIWNLPFTTGMGTGPANVAHAIVLKEPTMMTSALCDPLHEGWQFAPWPSKLRYFLFCLIFVLLLRVIHSAWRASLGLLAFPLYSAAALLMAASQAGESLGMDSWRGKTNPT